MWCFPATIAVDLGNVRRPMRRFRLADLSFDLISAAVRRCALHLIAKLATDEAVVCMM